jgi:hypothetical protein
MLLAAQTSSSVIKNAGHKLINNSDTFSRKNNVFKSSNSVSIKSKPRIYGLLILAVIGLLVYGVVSSGGHTVPTSPLTKLVDQQNSVTSSNSDTSATSSNAATTTTGDASGSNSNSVNVNVNGQQIKVPQNGNVNESIDSNGSQTNININSARSSTDSGSGSSSNSSSTSVNVNQSSN